MLLQKTHCVSGPEQEGRAYSGGYPCLPSFPGEGVSLLGILSYLGQGLPCPCSHPLQPRDTLSLCVPAVGAKVAVDKWTPGCDRPDSESSWQGS